MQKNFFGLLKESSLRGLLINLGILLMVILLLVLLFFYVYLPGVTNHSETITVPNLEGMTIEEMDEFLAKRNFRFEVVDSGYSSVYPPLTILKQYPKAGDYVKENRKIYLTVKAKEPQKVKMPDLIDGSLKNAELVLRSYGLRRGQIKYKADLAYNAILEQRYNDKPVKPGMQIPKGSEIDLVVGDGLGNRRFPTPDFVGLELEEADFSILASGLNVGSVIIRVLDSEQRRALAADAEANALDTARIFESGHVYKQRPVPGTEIRLGEQVDVWVSSVSEADSAEISRSWLDRAFEEPEETADEI